MSNAITNVCSSGMSTTKAPEWVSWDATDPNVRAPRRTFSIFRNKATGIRYGINYKDCFPKGWKTLRNGQIDVVLPGEESPDKADFTQWLSGHTLFGYVSFCIRSGLRMPPQAWNDILPRWVFHLFWHHGGQTIPRDYLSNPDFSYFRETGTNTGRGKVIEHDV